MSRTSARFNHRLREIPDFCCFANCPATDGLTHVPRWGTRYCPDHIDQARVFLDRLVLLEDRVIERANEERDTTPPQPAPAIDQLELTEIGADQ